MYQTSSTFYYDWRFLYNILGFWNIKNFLTVQHKTFIDLSQSRVVWKFIFYFRRLKHFFSITIQNIKKKYKFGIFCKLLFKMRNKFQIIFSLCFVEYWWQTSSKMLKYTICCYKMQKNSFSLHANNFHVKKLFWNLSNLTLETVWVILKNLKFFWVFHNPKKKNFKFLNPKHKEMYIFYFKTAKIIFVVKLKWSFLHFF